LLYNHYSSLFVDFYCSLRVIIIVETNCRVGISVFSA